MAGIRAERRNSRSNRRICRCGLGIVRFVVHESPDLSRSVQIWLVLVQFCQCFSRQFHERPAWSRGLPVDAAGSSRAPRPRRRLSSAGHCIRPCVLRGSVSSGVWRGRQHASERPSSARFRGAMAGSANASSKVRLRQQARQNTTASSQKCEISLDLPVSCRVLPDVRVGRIVVFPRVDDLRGRVR